MAPVLNIGLPRYSSLLLPTVDGLRVLGIVVSVRFSSRVLRP